MRKPNYARSFFVLAVFALVLTFAVAAPVSAQDGNQITVGNTQGSVWIDGGTVDNSTNVWVDQSVENNYTYTEYNYNTGLCDVFDGWGNYLYSYYC